MNPIDLDSIDRTQFDVKERDGRFLINPRKDKHKWEDHELWLRSLVCDAQGNILSLGFPKFMNLHEKPEEHTHALNNSMSVYATEKADGTLIILSYVDGQPYLRTRGSHDLGEFHDPVMRVINTQYPGLLKPTETGSMYEQYSAVTSGFSFLFEYVGPENQIVLQYNQDNLLFLAAVLWGEGTPLLLNSPEYLVEMQELWGLVPVKTRALDKTTTMAHVEHTPGREEEEGIVITCRNSTSEYMLIKVKTQWYLMLHALRFQMTTKKMHQLLTVEHKRNMCTFDEFQAYLYELGYDFEVSEILKEEAEAYFIRLRLAHYIAYEVCHWDGFYKYTERKDFVQAFRTELSHLPPWAFHYAMAQLDDKSPEECYTYVLAAVCGESTSTVKNWLQNKDTLRESLLKTPKDFEWEATDGSMDE